MDLNFLTTLLSYKNLVTFFLPSINSNFFQNYENPLMELLHRCSGTRDSFFPFLLEGWQHYCGVLIFELSIILIIIVTSNEHCLYVQHRFTWF